MFCQIIWDMIHRVQYLSWNSRNLKNVYKFITNTAQYNLICYLKQKAVRALGLHTYSITATSTAISTAIIGVITAISTAVLISWAPQKL